MPNKHYLRGRRFEYETMKNWKENYKVLRSAGSHSEFDVIAVNYAEDMYQVPLKAPAKVTMVRGGYEYTTYVRPIIGYGIQCKVKKVRK